MKVDAAIALFTENYAGRSALSEEAAADFADLKISILNGECQHRQFVIESERIFGQNQQIYGEGEPAEF